MPWTAGQILTAANMNTYLPQSASDWTSPFSSGVTTTSGTFTRKRYTQVGQSVTCELDFVFGASSAITADVILALPVTAAGTRGVGGDVDLYDDSAGAHYQGAVIFSSTTLVAIRRWRQSGVDDITSQTLSSTIPFTWTTNDRIIVHLRYLAD